MSITLSQIDVALINTIRRNPLLTKSEISSNLDISWSTVSTAIKSLCEDEMLTVKENELGIHKSQKAIYRATISINKNFEHYIGISVGSSNLKIVFVGFDFSYLIKTELFNNENELNMFENSIANYGFKCDVNDEYCRWCAPTPNNSQDLRHTLIAICNYICDLKETSNLKASAITFTFPGHIDYANQKIVSTANLCNKEINKSNISSLITSTVIKRLQDNGIDIFIDHNIKSSTIAEQEFLYTLQESNHQNMMVIYLGKGIGIGMILDNRLYRGNNNLAGQLGHISPKTDNKELEEIIWNDIFNSSSTNQKFETIPSIELKNYLAKNDDKKQLLICLLADTIKNIVQILGIEDIVFSGKFDSIFEEIEMGLISKFEELNFPNIILHHSHYGEYSAAMGAAMSCFNNKYKTPFEWNM